MSIEDDFKNRKNPHRRDQEPAPDDLFDDVELESEELFPEDDIDDIAGDLDMEEKLLREGLDRSSEGRKKPRELNTPGSVIGGRKRDHEGRNGHERKKKKGRIKRIIICAIVELLTLMVIFGYGYVLRTYNLMTRSNVDIAKVENDNISFEKKQEMEGFWNVAVFGLDASQRNSDVIMIVSINMDTGDIKLVSVFRDTYLNISEKNQYNKINQAYAQGGPEQALAALNKNLDLNITSYVTFNWKTIANIINMMGGVDGIEISNAEFYYINAFITETVKETGIGSVQLKSAGTHHLDGIQAVAYARLRLMDSDFARTERQKKIIMACFEKAKKMDYSELNTIMLTCFPQVETNVTLAEVVSMAQGILRYNIADTGGFPWSRGDARIPNKGACVIPTTLESNVIMLHEFLFGDEEYTVSDAVLRYSEKIKQDSNLYKEGTPIESVATDQGVIQRPKVSQEGTGDEAYETEAPTEREQSTEGYTFGVDEDGSLIYPTDEYGEFVIPTDENGDVIYPTDEDGNEITEGAIYGTRPERPTDLAGDDMLETGGDAGSELVDEDGNIIGTSPTRNPGSATRPTSQGGTTNVPTDAAGRPIMDDGSSGGPGTTTAASETTAAQRPGGSSGSGTQQPGGSTQPTSSSQSITDIPNEPVTVPQTTQAAGSSGPGSSSGTQGGSSSPGGSSQSGSSAGPGGSSLAPGSTSGPGGTAHPGSSQPGPAGPGA